ncbi:hypothetical protein AB0F15_11770 [Amycolatopsis sp. NPDC026612]|uniref:hypothetical protein n=1 Tax=Amycolatopsis sp. NPDC026612 TaxID=3155466 RepID=UPI0033C6410F
MTVRLGSAHPQHSRAVHPVRRQIRERLVRFGQDVRHGADAQVVRSGFDHYLNVGGDITGRVGVTTSPPWRVAVEDRPTRPPSSRSSTCAPEEQPRPARLAALARAP